MESDTVNLLQNANFTEKRNIEKILKNRKNFFTIYETDKKVIKFGDIEIEKQTFLPHKSPISIYDVNIDRVVISN